MKLSYYSNKDFFLACFICLQINIFAANYCKKSSLNVHNKNINSLFGLLIDLQEIIF